jgi:hypothetical protein
MRMPDWASDIIYTLTRWVHLVCTTLLVGGTLFFELVLPIAIEDLKNEQQFYVFARARLVWRWVVWISVIGLLASGSVSLYRVWKTYQIMELSHLARWALAHLALGVVGMIIALLLTIGSQPPENPVRWMRFNLVILLVVIFLGSATRHFQLALTERPEGKWKVAPVQFGPDTEPSTQPATSQPTPAAGGDRLP